MNSELHLWNAAPCRRLLQTSILALALCALAIPAPARQAGPDGEAGGASSEDGTGESLYDDPLAEELLNEQATPEGEEESEEEPYRHRDGATARRELLFRDGLYERERRYPKGLEPTPPVERSDLEAFDARYRGREAQVLIDAPPGLTVNGSLRAGLQVDDNPLLQRSEEVTGQSNSVWGYFVEPRVTVTRRTPGTLFQGVLRLPYDDLNSISGDANDDLGSFDQYAGLQFDVYGRKNAFNIFANIANATTRTEIVEDTGTGLSDEPVLTFGGGGSYKRTLSSSSVIQFSAAARRQDFENDGLIFSDEVFTAQLTDSTFFQLAGDYRRLISVSDLVGIGLIYEKFLPERDLNPDTGIITALASWSREVNPSMTFNLEAGAQIIDADNGSFIFEKRSTVSPYVLASLFWAISDKDVTQFTIGHTAEPSGTGDLRSSTFVEAEYRRRLTRNVSAGLPFTVLFQDPTLTNLFGSRTFVELAPNVAWAFGLHWGVGLEYRFRLNDEPNFSPVTSNAAFLTLGYFGRLYP